MNKVIDKDFRSCRFVSTIVKHPVSDATFVTFHANLNFSITLSKDLAML